MTNRIKGLCLMLATSVFALVPIFAQHKCGVTVADGQKIMAQMFQNRNEMRDFVRERDAVTYVPVRFHLVAKSDGTGRASERSGLSALCQLNEHYADQDIQFYIKEFTYIDNTNLYSDPYSNQGTNNIVANMEYNAINIFLVHDMAEEGVLGYYQPEAGVNGNDWIVALEGYADEKLVLTHEVGHFFSLNHTFYGWESTGGWDAALHGNPVGAVSPDQPVFGQTWYNEKVNGTNCTQSGDAICDTPADYMFPNNNCGYTQNAKDPNGQLLSPDFENFMNYVYGCGDYHFSDGQKEEIQNSLFSFNRSYIRPGYTPNLETVTGAPTMISPQSGELIESYNFVPLEWTALPGADKYLVELITAGQPTARYIFNSNTTVLTDLLPNKSYLWKVLGFNEYATCGSYSAQKIFKTGDFLNDTSVTLEHINWSIGPNPVRVGTPFLVKMDATKSIKADITVYTMTGQLVQEQHDVEFPFGKSSTEVETGDLAAGVYLVKMRTEAGDSVRRISVVQ